MLIDQRCFLTRQGIPWIKVTYEPLHPDGYLYTVTSAICGTYKVNSNLCGPDKFSPQMISHLEAEYADRLYILAAIALRRSEYSNPIVLDLDNVDDFFEGVIVPQGPLEQIDLILQYISDQSVKPGEFLHLYDNHMLLDMKYPIAFARDAKEFSWLIITAIELGYIEPKDSQEKFQTTAPPKDVRLSIKGFQRVHDLKKEGRDSRQAFVAMSFVDELETAWRKGIKPALEATGWKPLFLKVSQHNEKIDDLIVAEIRRSGLLIADFTGHRQNVYFEAGFAMGQGIPVIWTISSKDWSEKKAHFDTRQYNYIVWDSPQDLHEKLQFRIMATLPSKLPASKMQNR